VVVAKRMSFLRSPATFDWCSGDEKMKDVCYFVHLLCVSFALTGVLGAVFLQFVEHGVSLRMCEAYPAAALLMCRGEPLCW